jgi:potassium-transporting ATPase potassium-binding subunit
MWTLPVLLLAVTILLSIPLSRYFAWIMDGGYKAPRLLAWFEARLDSGPQDWKQYLIALLVFNTMLFVFGFIVLCLQPIAPSTRSVAASWRPRRSSIPSSRL